MTAARGRAGAAPDPEPSDELYDVDAVEAGAWVPGPNGPEDERGSFNEVTPDKTRRALGLLDLARPVTTYSLGEELFNGYPTWGERSYEQRLVVMGYQPAPGFEGEIADPLPQGPGRNAVHEERISGGTPADSQGLTRQEEALRAAGVEVFGSNHAAALAAAGRA